MKRPNFYFDHFEDRLPEPPLQYSRGREVLYQLVATMSLVFGSWYIVWRWVASLNPDALWFAIPLVVAETCAFFGVILFTINLWKDQPVPEPDPPASFDQCLRPEARDASASRPLVVDVFYPTYNEDPELVRLSIEAGKALTYPHEIDLRIHVLDDGKRPEMERVAREEGVNYLTRENNIGFKAGNMRNGMEHTSGDFLVICDADTRVFPNFLEETLGYFRDPDMAWVQTPQWFFDLDEGRPLHEAWGSRLGLPGRWAGRLVQAIFGPITSGVDPFTSDPKLFYDVLQRRRNWANAAFCCGAGSVHRREAVMQAALRRYVAEVEHGVDRAVRSLDGDGLRSDVEKVARQRMIHDVELTPYKFHVSEDIYTSIVLHEDTEHTWHSVLHPRIVSKMLSPQDLESWVVQQFKYAGGTLDIAIHDNPVFRRGMSLPQKLMYGMTFWSYLGGLWNLIFLLAPAVYMLTGAAPVRAYTFDFFVHILPFLVFNELATMIGCWGLPGYQAKAGYLARFSMNLRALWLVLKGSKIHFPTTPKDRNSGVYPKLVLPQIGIVALTIVAIGVGVWRWSQGAPGFELSGLLVNSLWGLYNVLALSTYIRAAFWQPPWEEEVAEAQPELAVA